MYIPIHSTRKWKVFFRINGLVNLGWARGSVESCKKTRKVPLQRPSFGGYMRVCLGYPNPHGLEVSYSGTTRNQSSLFFNMWYAISMRTPQESSRKLPFCFLVSGALVHISMDFCSCFRLGLHVSQRYNTRDLLRTSVCISLSPRALFRRQLLVLQHCLVVWCDAAQIQSVRSCRRRQSELG